MVVIISAPACVIGMAIATLMSRSEHDVLTLARRESRAVASQRDRRAEASGDAHALNRENEGLIRADHGPCGEALVAHRRSMRGKCNSRRHRPIIAGCLVSETCRERAKYAAACFLGVLRAAAISPSCRASRVSSSLTYRKGRARQRRASAKNLALASEIC